MSMFILGISCLTTFKLSWFMDLTFQVLVHIVLYSFRLNFHHQPHPPLDIIYFFESASLFLLKLFIYSSPVAYWTPIDLGVLSFSVISFCFFILFMGFSSQEYWSSLPFPSPVDHILSELSTMTHVDHCYCLVTKSCLSLLRSHGLKPSRLLCTWDCPGRNTRVGCCFFLQGIFPTPRSSPHLLNWQWSL